MGKRKRPNQRQRKAAAAAKKAASALVAAVAPAGYTGPVTKKRKRPMRWCEKWVVGKRPRAALSKEQKDMANKKARERYGKKVGSKYKPRGPRKK